MLSASLLLAATMVVGQAEKPVGPTADDYLTFVRAFFPGTWHYKATTQDGDVLAQGVMEAEIKENQPCAVTVQTIEGEKSVNIGIHGYDPAEKCWRVLQFLGDGSMLEMQVHMSMKTLKSRKYEDLTYRHRNTLTLADGTREVSKWKATIEDKDTLELRCIEANKKGPAVMRFERKK